MIIVQIVDRLAKSSNKVNITPPYFLSGFSPEEIILQLDFQNHFSDPQSVISGGVIQGQ